MLRYGQIMSFLLSRTTRYGPAVTEEDPLIGYREMAKRAGVSPSTLRKYRSQGRLPDPDDASVPDRPRWRLSTFEEWMATRPGPGTRTDLQDRIEPRGDATRLLADDHVKILQALVESEALGTLDVCAVLNPGPPTRDGRTREHKAWVNRTLEIRQALLDLAERDLVDLVIDANTGADRLNLTAAGRAFLAGQ